VDKADAQRNILAPACTEKVTRKPYTMLVRYDLNITKETSNTHIEKHGFHT
jgi:hypothetical protein